MYHYEDFFPNRHFFPNRQQSHINCEVEKRSSKSQLAALYLMQQRNLVGTYKTIGSYGVNYDAPVWTFFAKWYRVEKLSKFLKWRLIIEDRHGHAFTATLISTVASYSIWSSPKEIEKKSGRNRLSIYWFRIDRSVSNFYKFQHVIVHHTIFTRSYCSNQKK